MHSEIILMIAACIKLVLVDWDITCKINLVYYMNIFI